MCYSARLSRVFASVDCEFDATFFPYKLSDQRQRGYYDTEVRTEELEMFHDMPNATQQDFIESLNSEECPVTQRGDSIWSWTKQLRCRLSILHSFTERCLKKRGRHTVRALRRSSRQTLTGRSTTHLCTT